MKEEDFTFRFSNKSDYEQELTRLLKSSKKSKNKKQQYEELIEEYLRFCGDGEENGK